MFNKETGCFERRPLVNYCVRGIVLLKREVFFKSKKSLQLGFPYITHIDRSCGREL